MIQKNKYGAVYAGKPAEGCELCWPGKKLVLFVTGKCNRHCWYCPISAEKFGKDLVFANERPVKNEQDILTEAKEMDACGAGITGGEPFLVLDKVCSYIKLLKQEFGYRFHVHLYTWGDLATAENLKKLEDAGLDEIRFHLLGNFERILPSLKTKIKTGVEVPAIPGQKEELLKLLEFCEKNKVAFVNLNEFEFSDSNYAELEKKGFVPVSEETYAVKGSKELALGILEYAEKNYKELSVHFCPVSVKNGVQLTNRLKRRAMNMKKQFERINEFGFLVKGVVEGSLEKLEKIKEKYPRVFLNEKKQRIETSVQFAKKIAKEFKLKAFEVHEYPIYEPWDFEKTPLYVFGKY